MKQAAVQAWKNTSGVAPRAGRVSARRRGAEVIYLALRKLIAKWGTVQHWKAALNRFTLLGEDRIQAARVS